MTTNPNLVAYLKQRLAELPPQGQGYVADELLLDCFGNFDDARGWFTRQGGAILPRAAAMHLLVRVTADGRPDLPPAGSRTSASSASTSTP